ncbi:unnamed protein product, partial [Brassica napus]
DEVTNSSVEISLRDQVWLEWKKLRLRQGRLMREVHTKGEATWKDKWRVL